MLLKGQDGRAWPAGGDLEEVSRSDDLEKQAMDTEQFADTSTRVDDVFELKVSPRRS